MIVDISQTSRTPKYADVTATPNVIAIAPNVLASSRASKLEGEKDRREIIPTYSQVNIKIHDLDIASRRGKRDVRYMELLHLNSKATLRHNCSISTQAHDDTFKRNNNCMSAVSVERTLQIFLFAFQDKCRSHRKAFLATRVCASLSAGKEEKNPELLHRVRKCNHCY